MACPCGRGRRLEECCGPVIEGERPAPTAEALMRARYTAYVTGAVDFVVSSHHPKTRDNVDREGAASWSKEADWKGLEILATEGGGEDDDTGTVEFVAHYETNGAPISHHEKARFEKQGGGWCYVDGDVVRPKPVRRDGPKVGRNEPCPCGSGKKHKKCCGAA